LFLPIALLGWLAGGLSAATTISLLGPGVRPDTLPQVLPGGNESDGGCWVTLFRSGDLSGTTTVGFQTIDDTAKAGTDYVSQSSSVVFHPGEAYGEVRVLFIDNSHVDEHRELAIALTQSLPSVEILTPWASLPIFDDEKPALIDYSFGDSGLILENALAITSEGKTFVTRYFEDGGAGGIKLLRLNSDGSQDAGFAPTVVQNPHDMTWVSTITFDGSGGMLLAGGFGVVNGFARTNLARLNGDGVLDTNFAGPVLEFTPYQPPPPAFTPDHRLLVLHAGNRLTRLHEDGSVDLTFNASIDSLPPAALVASLPDGRVLVGVQATNPANAHLLYRLERNGAIDPTFHSAGFSGASTNEWELPTLNDLKVQPDGRMVVGGYFISIDSIARVSIARLNSDGTVDTTFAPTPGLENFSGGDSKPTPGVVTTVNVETSGRITCGGQFELVNRRFRGGARMVRFSPDGLIDSTPRIHPRRVLLQNAVQDAGVSRISRINEQNSGSTIVAGSLRYWVGFLPLSMPFVTRLRASLPENEIEFEVAGLAQEKHRGVSLSLIRLGDVSETATVQYTTADGTAIAGQDYEPRSGVLTFAPFQTEEGIYIPLIDDDLPEENETFSVTLSNSAGVSMIARPAIQVRIADDDFGLQISGWSNTGPILNLHGAVGMSYVVEFTPLPDLNRSWWDPLSTVILKANPQAFEDANAAGVSSRFYRVRQENP